MFFSIVDRLNEAIGQWMNASIMSYSWWWQQRGQQQRSSSLSSGVWRGGRRKTDAGMDSPAAGNTPTARAGRSRQSRVFVPYWSRLLPLTFPTWDQSHRILKKTK